MKKLILLAVLGSILGGCVVYPARPAAVVVEPRPYYYHY